MALWKNGRFEADSYANIADTEALPAGPVIISLQRFETEKTSLAKRTDPFGIKLQPHDSLDFLSDKLPGLALLALNFPKFADGRAFSLARLAREHYGFSGELRAVGDVLLDRLSYMVRCGFDAFDITNAPTIAALQAGWQPASLQYYQPAHAAGAVIDTLKPWRRHV